MPGIVVFPTVVQHALEDYRDLFASEPQRRHFAEYLTGLMLAERKTVLGNHSEFADIADQSCLNRFLTEVEWDVEELIARRIELLQRQSETRFTERGVRHKVRLLFIWVHRRDAQPKKILVKNRTTWEKTRILLAYRERCRAGCAAHGRRTGTETFHRDGKQQLGLGDCQPRIGQGQTRHMYLVFLAHTLLTCQPRQSRAKD